MSDFVFIRRYGAHRTGTNYLYALLLRNFSNIYLLKETLGWKHNNILTLDSFSEELEKLIDQFPNAEVFKQFKEAFLQNQIKTIFSIKNPYAWIRSIYRYASQSSEQHFTEEMTRPTSGFIGMLRREGLNPDTATIALERYNNLYRNWLAYFFNNPSNCFLSRYERLLTDLPRTLNNIGALLGLEKIGEDYQDIKIPVGPTKHNVDFRDYYLNSRYLKELSPEIIGTVTKVIDWKLMKKINYHPLTP